MAMRYAAAVLTLAAGLGGTTSALAQPAPPPASSAQPSDAAACVARRADLGGIGQATVVAFTGAIFRDRVCAIVANVAIDAFTARVDSAGTASSVAAGADATLSVPLISAALGEGGSVTLPLEGATIAGVGPYVVEPGGKFPSFGGDTEALPRVVLAYAGQRVLVIGTTPVALVDVARALRDQPDLFGADAVERAVVLASGAPAALSLHTADGTFGPDQIGTQRILHLIKRG